MEEVLGGSVGGVRAMLIGRVAAPISASPLPFSTILKAVGKILTSSLHLLNNIIP